VSMAVHRMIKNVDMVFTSPYVRARQTAEIFLEKKLDSRLVEIEELKPNKRPEKLLRALQKLSRSSTVVVVGHEPHLSRFISFALTGSGRGLLDLKKAGFAILEFSGRIEKKQAKVTCFLQPSQLKKLKIE
jgi:phosphohistidine phosphatase